MNNKSTLLLEHHLKELKLPTFLREYDKVASRSPPRESTIQTICCDCRNLS